jgi:hypothetical protein
MLENRFSEYWDTPELEPAQSWTGFQGAVGAFVLCPCPIMQSIAMPQYAMMDHLYRLAYAQAQAQMGEIMRMARFDFSIN